MCVIRPKTGAIRKSSSLADVNNRSTGLGMRKTVSFSSVDDVCQVSHSYPSDFFYTQSETNRLVASPLLVVQFILSIMFY